MKHITLDTDHTSYQMAVDDFGHLLHLYYGPKIQCEASIGLQYYDRGFSGNPYDARNDRTYSLDVLPQEYPTYGTGDYRSTAFNMTLPDGTPGCDLRYVSHRMLDSKYSLDGLPAAFSEAGETLEVVLADENAGVEVTLLYGILKDVDVITRAARIKNIGKDKIYVEKAFSAAVDFMSGKWDLIHFAGRHGMERQYVRDPIHQNKISVGSIRGTSSHQHSPYVILAGDQTCEDHGGCLGLNFLYSGNFKAEATRDQFGLTRVVMGMQDEMFRYPLEPGEVLETPELAMSYTEEGLNQLSHNFHRFIRNHVIRSPYEGKRPPILINNWEATYFDFNGEQIYDIAKQASELGVEMMVLDDGWFGKRDSDDSGLGDWWVNEEKLGGTLSELSDKIHGLGMKFGLWIEPEMVNEDSDLYREHPDWAFSVPGRNPVRSRNQLVLDFSREEIVDHVFNEITKVLDTTKVEYIKMDMNRSIYDVFSNTDKEQSFGKTMHQYVKGVYRFIERLRKRYPDLLIEGCSGGGGRFDAGMLYYTPQIWTSDNTDAIERIAIQHGTSFGFPIQTMGSHVSAVPNEQTGRIVPIHTRSVVAQSGTFGYELDLNKISDEEKEAVKEQIEDYKRFWPLITTGRYYRIHEPGRDHELAAWMFVSEDQKEALVNAVTLDTHFNAPVNYIWLRGLKEDALYRVEEVSSGKKPEPWILSGSLLMASGIPVPIIPGEYHAWQWKIEMIEKENENEKRNS